ncbi:hypothetical protein ACIO87_03735 [Streptomyces sp. NPDC087218]|uniref:hypothetical protein n=1 Tax=Streptomyces sp. NPDC087218 TaxID=3365769 RepID=UPI003830945F
MKRPTTGVFHKPAATREQAEAEAKGWERLASRIAVPALHGQIAVPDRQLLAYEDVFATGRCELLMGDVIALADRDPAVQPRLDRWYLRRDLPLALPHTDTTLPLRELADFTLTVNGWPLRVNVADTIDSLRHALAPDRRRLAGLTQGDPTEPNIAGPRCWLDFEFAGRNSVAGEAANLLWYLMALGGWLVPRYQPDVYDRTLRLALPPLSRPRIEHLEPHPSSRHIDVRYSWNTSPGRTAALTRALNGLRIENGSGMEEIRAFLALRILGVIPPSRLTGHDLLLVLIKLAESQAPHMTLDTFFTTTPAPHPHPGERSGNVPAPA